MLANYPPNSAILQMNLHFRQVLNT